MTARTTVLVIPDGASEPLGADRTCLERARTPVLDTLARRGTAWRVATTPAGAAPGTEVGVPRLLRVTQPLARGRLEAAAAGISLDADEGAWRLDVLDARRRPSVIGAEEAAALDEALGALGGQVRALGGHRHLLTGPSWWGDAPPGPHQTDRPLRAFAVGPFGGVAKAARAALQAAGGRRRTAWPWGAIGEHVRPSTSLPGVLGREVVVVPDAPVVRGVATLLGCQTAESMPVDLPRGGLVVWHLAAPDEAAHARDAAAKIAAIEAVDAALAPLLDADAAVIVCPDHGADPETGEHRADPVPAVVVGGAVGGRASRLTERAARHAPLVDATALLASLIDGVAA